MKRCYYVEYGRIVSTSRSFATNIYVNTYEKSKTFYDKEKAEQFAKKVNGKITQGIKL